MKTFLCWGISKLEGLFGLLIWPMMFIVGDKEELITNQGILNEAGWILLLTAVVGAAIPAIFTAIYAVKNFDEVTSYSMLFYSSRSSMLDSKIKYFIRTMFTAGLLWAMVIFTVGLFFI